MRHILVRRIVLEIHEVKLPCLQGMLFLMICIGVDQDFTLLALHPGEPLFVIQHQDAMLMRGIKQFVVALLLHLDWHTVSPSSAAGGRLY